VTGEDGVVSTEFYATVVFPDGSKADVVMSYDAKNMVGHTAKMIFKDGSAMLTQSSSSNAGSGYVNAQGHTLGSTNKLANDIKIIDLDQFGNIVTVSLTRLNGVMLNSDNILLSTRNTAGEIDGMILDNVTGDTAKYGTVTSVDKISVPDKTFGGTDIGGTFEYDIAGVSASGNISSFPNVASGPSAFSYKDGKLAKINSLDALGKTITSANPVYLTASDGREYKVSPDVKVYQFSSGYMELTSIEAAATGSYHITAYIDKEQNRGGLVRVIYLK
jgi:hypothetical protein